MKVGAIAYCHGPKGPLVCFVTSRRHKNALTLPKGIVWPDEKLATAALRELFEEAGIKGKIRRKLRPMLFTSKHQAIDDVLYFFIEIRSVSKVWPESGLRDRLFLSVEDAVVRNTSFAAKKVLQSLNKTDDLGKLIRRKPGKKYKLFAKSQKGIKKFVA